MEVHGGYTRLGSEKVYNYFFKCFDYLEKASCGKTVLKYCICGSAEDYDDAEEKAKAEADDITLDILTRENPKEITPVKEFALTTAKIQRFASSASNAERVRV